MKKIMAACALVLLCSPAFAQEKAYKPYLGFDLQRISASYQSENVMGVNIDYGDVFEDSLNALNIHGGVRFAKNFGLELGYFHSSEEDSGAYSLLGVPVLNSASVKLHGFTLDGMGYVPVHERIDLMGTAGVSWMKAEVEYDAAPLGIGTIEDDESEFGLRIGGGAQFAVTENIALRALVRYQTMDFEDTLDSAWIYSAGLNYTFD